MRKVALYFNDVYLDLFGDEDIVLTRKATDYRELGRVYTDFTQTFTVPATPKNNKALKHYYDMTVLNGYAQSESVPGRIEVDTLPVRSGVFIIEGAKFTNGLPSSYSLVFYGDLKSLKDTFGEDKLEDLDLSSYDHAHSFSNVETGVEGAGLKSGEIYYPLISPVRKWFYNSASSNHDDNNIAYHSGHSSNDHGIRHYELKPALKVAPIIDAIESKYGITFNSTFFGSSAFTDLYLWLHRNEGYMPVVTQPISVSVTTTFLQHTWNNTTKILTADYDCTMTFRALGASGLPLIFDIYKNNVLVVRGYESSLTYSIDVLTDDEIEFRFATFSLGIENNATLTIELSDGVYTTGTGIQLLEFDAAQLFYYSYAYMNRIMPDVKVYDFMTSLIRMFNLIVYPTAANTFEIEPYSDWIGDQTHDISRYVDMNNMSLAKSNIFGNIEFNHNEPGTYAGKEYFGREGIGYGDLNLVLDYRDAETFEVESGAEMPIFERLIDADDDTATDISIASIIEDNTADPSPYLGGLWFLYYQDKATGLTKTFNLLTADGNDNEVSAYHRFGVCNESSLSANTLSLAFGATIDPYFGGLVTRGLYTEYYQEQVNDIFDSRTRITDLEAILPLNIIINLQMNDYLVVGDLIFRINEIKINLNTGRTKMKLINVK